MKYYLLLLLWFFYSCDEKPCEIKLKEKIEDIDFLKQKVKKIKLSGDSLNGVMNSELFKYYPRESFSFNLYPSNYTIKKGEEMQVIAVIRLKPDSAAFMALRCELKDKADEEDFYRNLTPVGDTLFPSKKTNYNSILIKSPTTKDTIGWNAKYYLLLYAFKNNDTIKSYSRRTYKVVK